jgi:hypothetical protein
LLFLTSSVLHLLHLVHLMLGFLDHMIFKSILEA